MVEGGVWRTISGRRVFIKDGQSLTDAMKSSGKFKDLKESKESKYDKLKKRYDAEFKRLNDLMEKGENPPLEEIDALMDMEKELEQLKAGDDAIEAHELLRVQDSFKKLPTDAQGKVLGQLDELYEEFGGDFVEQMNLTAKHMDNSMLASHTDGNRFEMTLNETLLRDPENYSQRVRYQMDNGWFVKGPKGKEIEAVVVHEFGHHLQSRLSRTATRGLTDAVASKQRRTFIDKYYDGKSDSDVMSKYGKSDDYEWFAESFVNYYYNRGNNAHGKAFGSFLEKELIA